MKFTSIDQIKIVYMGTPSISSKVLEGLIKNGFNIVALVTNEDKEVGRKRIVEPTHCKKVALEHGIKVFQPHRIKEDYSFLQSMDFDLILTMAYGQIVPNEVLNCPKIGCLNLHGSLLPKYRGAAPIQRAIMDGEKYSGITLMEMVEKMDAGKMYDKEMVEIEEGDNYSSLCDKLSIASIKVATRSILPYANNELPGIEQDENEVTFAKKIKPEDEHIPFNNLTCVEFNNYVRGLSLTPGAYLLIDNQKFKIFKSHTLSNEVKGETGQLVSLRKGVYLQLKDGIVSLDLVQMQGKKEIDGLSFSNGSRHLEGKVLN